MKEGKIVAERRGAVGWGRKYPLPATFPRTQAGRPIIPSAAPVHPSQAWVPIEVTAVATSMVSPRLQ